MTAFQTGIRPAATGREFRSNRLDYGHKPSTHGRLPADWRSRLPDPANYFAQHVGKIGRPSASGWASCECPFHQDASPSASVNLRHGGFCCHACGIKHDLLGFHERITGLKFPASVRDLIGWRP